MLSLLIVASALASDTTARPVAALPDPAPTVAAEPAAAAPPAPASVARVRALLGARHTADLPSRAALDAQPGAAEALTWIAQYGETLIESERALGLLALYPEAAHASMCMELLQGPAHAKIRAGAARCLTGQDLSATQPALVTALSDKDVRVGVAAADALRAHAGAVEALDAKLVAGLPEVVKVHLTQQ